MVVAVKSSALHSVMDRPLSQPWWRLKLWQQLLLGLTALILLIVTGLLLLGPAQRSVSIPAGSLTIAAVERGVYHDIIPITGEVVPHDTVFLDAVEGGRIEHLLVQAGDRVTQGQPLVQLSNSALELDVLDREGRLVQSITESQSYQTQLEQNRVANQKLWRRSTTTSYACGAPWIGVRDWWHSIWSRWRRAIRSRMSSTMRCGSGRCRRTATAARNSCARSNCRSFGRRLQSCRRIWWSRTASSPS